MRLPIALLSVLQLTLAAQTISVDGSGNAPSSVASSTNTMTSPSSVVVAEFGFPIVELVPYTSSEFSSLVSTAATPGIRTAIEPLLPYSVFLRNTGSQPIIAYTLSWVWNDVQLGRPYKDYHSFCDLIQLRPLIAPGNAGLATALGPLTDPQMVNSPQMMADVVTQAKEFQSRQSITITLESVMLAHGTAYGRDASKSVPRLKAMLKAEYDLFTEAVQKLGVSSQSDIMSYLNSVAATSPPGSSLQLGTDPYSAWYQHYAANTARTLVNRVAKNGFTETISYVQFVLQSKPYPALLIN